MVDLFSLTTFDGKGCCCSAIGTVILESTHLSDDSLRYSSVVSKKGIHLDDTGFFCVYSLQSSSRIPIFLIIRCSWVGGVPQEAFAYGLIKLVCFIQVHYC